MRTRWAQVDYQGTRYLLGDSFGRLTLLALTGESTDNSKLNLLYLGEVRPFVLWFSYSNAIKLVDIRADNLDRLALAVHIRRFALRRFSAHSH